jgi:hypothetical protein
LGSNALAAFWRDFLARFFGALFIALFWRVFLARFFGALFWRAFFGALLVLYIYIERETTLVW